MDPFINYDFTTKKNVTFGEYGNSTEINNPTYVDTTIKEIPIEHYLNQLNLENNNNSYNTTYLSGTNDNNYSYPFSDKINSEKSNYNNNYYNNLLSNEYFSNINNNNYGNIKNISEINNMSNFATVKPLSKKAENINYANYANNSDLLNPSTNVNYYSDNTTDFYTGSNNNNLESIPYLVSSTTNDISNINLNENYSYTLNNNISNINYNYNYIPNTTDSPHVSYNNNVISKNNITLNSNNIYSVNALPKKYKEGTFGNANEENSKGLNKMRSKYLIDIIFNYIEDDNFKYKLFIHSKKFRKLLGLSSNDYQEKSISKTGIKLGNYLSGFLDRNYGPHTYYYKINKKKGNDYYREFKRETLKNEFLLHLEMLKIKYIKNYIVYYYKKYKENKKDDSNLYIDIFCPFFELLSNQSYFSELFTIPIMMPFIRGKLLENEYISTFDKLNKSQIDLSILFKYTEEEDLDFFKKCVNLNKVRKLIIYEDITQKQYYFYHTARPINDKSLPPEKKKMANLFSKITSGNNLVNNLLYLKLNLKSFTRKELNLLENLNLFKSLNYLELEYFRFFGKDVTIFELKLDTLRVLKLFDCNCITISNNCCLHLKELYIIKSKIEKKNSSLFKFPNLEKCKFYLYLEDDWQKDEDSFNSIIDFSILRNLKVLNCEANDFLMLKNTSLESLTVLSNDIDNSKEKEKRIIEKIISMKSLKELTLSLKLLDENDISGINGINTSVEKLVIHLHIDCTVINLQKKFPYVNSFSLVTKNDSNFTYLQIEENANCKINKLTLYTGISYIRLYCVPFVNLVELDLIIFTKELNAIKESLPLFSNNCLLVFKALKSFKFTCLEIEFELLNNICDNLEKMPNLKTLVLKCEIEVDKNFYDKINRKISLMKLNDIKIEILRKYADYNIGFENKKLQNSFNEYTGIVIRK